MQPMRRVTNATGIEAVIVFVNLGTDSVPQLMSFRGTVANAAALPVTAARGDTWITLDDGHAHLHDGTRFWDLGVPNTSSGGLLPAVPASNSAGMVLTVTPAGGFGWQQPGGIPNGSPGQWLTWDSAGKPVPGTLPTTAKPVIGFQQNILLNPGSPVGIIHNLNDARPVVTVWDQATATIVDCVVAAVDANQITVDGSRPVSVMVSIVKAN